jgi:hypothetical protein
VPARETDAGCVFGEHQHPGCGRIPLGGAPLAADTGEVSELIETLAAALERPRQLSARVVNYISGTYGVDDDAIGPFLVDGLPKLEDYEIDLILSPPFTPRLTDQTIFAELLGGGSVSREQWPALIQELVARPTRAQLLTTDGRSHSVVLREVTIERYVHRLRLEAAIPESLLKLLDRIASAADRPLLRAVARRAIWDHGARRDILARYLASAAERDSYRLSDAVELLNLVESCKPDDVADLLSRIPRRQQVLRDEVNGASAPKPFFSGEAQQLHGGGRDQRRQDDARVAAKQDELAFLDRLQHLLAG